jgi:hypothetical protein
MAVLRVALLILATTFLLIDVAKADVSFSIPFADLIGKKPKAGEEKSAIACFTCEMMGELFETTITLGKTAFENFRDVVLAVVSTVAGLYILWSATKLLSPMGNTGSGLQIANNLFITVLAAIFATTFLLKYTNVWKYIYLPILATAFNLVHVIMENTNQAMEQVMSGALNPSFVATLQESDAFKKLNKQIQEQAGKNDVVDEANQALDKLKSDPKAKEFANKTVNAVDDINERVNLFKPCASIIISAGDGIEQIRDNFVCMLENMQRGIGRGLELSFSAMLSPLGNDKKNWFGIVFNIGSLIIAVAGAAVLLLFIWLPLYLSFPLKIGDIVLRWTIITMLLPFMIAAFILPAIRGSLFRGIVGMIQSGIELFIMAIIISVISMTLAISIDPSLSTGLPILMNMEIFWLLLLIGTVGQSLMAKAKVYAQALVPQKGISIQLLDEYGKTVSGLFSKILPG